MIIVESGKFKQWLKKLKDETGKARIVARINRLVEGLPGDVASVGDGVSCGYIMDRGTGFIFINRETKLLYCFVAAIREPNAGILLLPGRF